MLTRRNEDDKKIKESLISPRSVPFNRTRRKFAFESRLPFLVPRIPVNNALNISALLARLHATSAAIGRPVALMEVCGTHTMSAFRSGLRSLLPDHVHLLSGPGCPVCVTAQGDIDLLLEVARLPEVTLCTYGDMLRVPGRAGSLERARSLGADVRVIYSTLDAVAYAQEHPQRKVILGAVGFETTAPATAAAVLRAKELAIHNFLVLASHKRVVPAMIALLESGDVRLDGFLLPGHVSAIIGVECYRVVVEASACPAWWRVLRMATWWWRSCGCWK